MSLSPKQPEVNYTPIDYVDPQAQVQQFAEEVFPNAVVEWMFDLTLIDVAEQTDAEDYSILIYGEHLDGTDASLFDYGVTLGGFFIPAVSGSAVKNAGEGLIDWVRRGTGKKVDNVIDGSSEVVENGVSKGVKELEYGGKIGHGHAWDKHADQFPEINSKEEFSEFIDGIIKDPSDYGESHSGRIGFWDETTDTIVIVDPNNVDFGTAFKPDEGKAYFDKHFK